MLTYNDVINRYYYTFLHITMKIDNTKNKIAYCICGVAEYEKEEIRRNRCKDCGRVPYLNTRKNK